MAELYPKDVQTISEHLKNIYVEGEREVAREIDHYSLEAILAVGYRVRSQSGTQFRRWATDRLKGHLGTFPFWCVFCPVEKQ